jgi:four helix bundle protein
LGYISTLLHSLSARLQQGSQAQERLMLGCREMDDRAADIRARAFSLACEVTKAAMDVRRPVSFSIIDQLLRASTSVGANLEEAKAASSQREFIRMCEISLREAREAAYWIRICVTVQMLPPSAARLQAEADEIARILATIVLNTKRRLAAQDAVAE